MTETELKEKRGLCFWNLERHAGKGGCSVPLEKCAECKADKTMPIGLESIIANGFNGIVKLQQKIGEKE